MQPAAYHKRFEIRWSDLDPNRHVANSAYSAFMSHVRMSFLHEQGFSQEKFAAYNLGPVILKEEFHYLKEVMPAETVTIDLRQSGATADMRFVRWEHRLFNTSGLLAVFSRVIFCLIDLHKRKIATPPAELQQIFKNLEKTPRFRLLTKSDLRNPELYAE
ncbi:MAG: hypothetical protein KatS3mg031_0051 [Chitinophagales bacterium]|nr:MAG: hypothetical protein KatS3mg031_0051 [Chitinophagales bacterium]